jgi:glycosyltransferase involved in cell wall biosynthesis
MRAIELSANQTIAHILPFPNVGGTEQGALRVAQAANDGNFKHIAFYLDGAYAVRDLFADVGFETVPYTHIEPSYRHIVRFFRESKQLADEFKRCKVSLVHCADISAAFFVGLAGRLARVPVISHVRNRCESLSRRDKSFLWNTKKFVFVSQETWKRFALGVSPQRGFVLYDGIELNEKIDVESVSRDVRCEFDISDDTRIVGMSARVAPQKDYETLAKAAARVVAQFPNVVFLIVGGYDDKAEHREHFVKVKEWLSKHNVTSHFIFTGFRRDVPRLVAAMNSFVLCTHWEGLPLVLLEAMAQSKPVVATAVDGVPEIIIDGRTGLLHQHQDDAKLAEQMLTLLTDEEYAKKLGHTGYQFVAEKFSAAQFSTNVMRLYNEVLNRNEAN